MYAHAAHYQTYLYIFFTHWEISTFFPSTCLRNLAYPSVFFFLSSCFSPAPPIHPYNLTFLPFSHVYTRVCKTHYIHTFLALSIFLGFRLPLPRCSTIPSTFRLAPSIHISIYIFQSLERARASDRNGERASGLGKHYSQQLCHEFFQSACVRCSPRKLEISEKFVFFLFLSLSVRKIMVTHRWHKLYSSQSIRKMILHVPRMNFRGRNT